MLNISKQIHAGWDANTAIPTDQILHEAEIIPDGTAPNELKKLEKFTQKYSKIVTVDNVPMPGFTLYDVSKQKWSTTDSTWLVIDPRGFITRITNNNLANILKVTGITEGLIQQKCVWARQDSSTVLTLVPISSANYAVAVNNTEILDAKVSIKDVEIGDTVLLQNGLQGKYMGVLSMYSNMEKTFKGSLKASVMLRKQIIEILPGKFHYNTDVKILKVITKTSTPMTKEDSASYINNCIKTNPNFYFSQGTKFTTGHQVDYKQIRMASANAEPKVKIKLEEIDRAQAEDLFHEALANRSQGILMLEYASGNRCVVEFPWQGSLTSLDVASFPVENILSTSDTEIQIESRKNIVGYYSSIAPRATSSLDKFAKFYKITKHVRALSYI